MIEMHNMERKIASCAEQLQQRDAVDSAAHPDGPGAGGNGLDREFEAVRDQSPQ